MARLFSKSLNASLRNKQQRIRPPVRTVSGSWFCIYAARMAWSCGGSAEMGGN